MSYPATHQEPYTQFPNRYNDTIKPRLTDTQRDICDVVIRQTSGWHQPSAPISNTDFMRRTRKSRQGIINAKKQLVEQGLLIVLEQGGGSTKNVYMLDLWYNDPDKSIKVAMLKEKAALLEMVNQLPLSEQENIPELALAPSINEPTTFEEPEAVIETPPEIKVESTPEIEDSPNVESPEPQVIESENSTPEEPPSDQGISDSELPENPVRIEVSELSTSQLSVPPFKEGDLSSNLSINIKEEIKQTESSETEAEKENRKTATATVCSLFRSWGTELQPNDYAFVGWSLKTYGVDVVQQKLEIMKHQQNRGVSFSNPLGWLRSALSRDYSFSKWDTEVLKGKERADKASERAKLEQKQREHELWKIEELQKEAKKMKTQLTPKDREELRQKAIIQILSMEGMTRNWINEPLIESIENQILRNTRSV